MSHSLFGLIFHEPVGSRMCRLVPVRLVNEPVMLSSDHSLDSVPRKEKERGKEEEKKEENPQRMLVR